MPKKTRPITVLTEDELNALDDATFAELAADEERLHQALQDFATIPSGQALSRKTAPRQLILDSILNREDEDDIDPPGSGTGITSAHDQASAQGTVKANADLKGPRTVLGPSAKSPRNGSKQSLISIDNGASIKV